MKTQTLLLWSREKYHKADGHRIQPDSSIEQTKGRLTIFFYQIS